jgi:hypothetical protein
MGSGFARKEKGEKGRSLVYEKIMEKRKKMGMQGQVEGEDDEEVGYDAGGLGMGMYSHAGGYGKRKKVLEEEDDEEEPFGGVVGGAGGGYSVGAVGGFGGRGGFGGTGLGEAGPSRKKGRKAPVAGLTREGSAMVPDFLVKKKEDDEGDDEGDEDEVEDEVEVMKYENE